MVGEQLCQKLACFRYPCSSHEIKSMLFHQPEFMGLSFTHTTEAPQQNAHAILPAGCLGTVRTFAATITRAKGQVIVSHI